MSASSLLMLLGFALTLFTSATLLFLVQPMIGKMITPLLGGTPAVWNTCMVFFQALLLAGYSYAHATTAWLGARKQAVLHLMVLVVPLVFLAYYPLTVDRSYVAGGDQNPIASVLLVLTMSVGLPFFVVSTSAPLLQKWFASTDHPSAADPYFLYGASNLGSMIALLGYPPLVEPYLRLASQRWVWCIGYGMLVLLQALCAVCLWRAAPAPVPAPAGSVPPSPEPAPRPAKASESVTGRRPAERARGSQQVTTQPKASESASGQRPVERARGSQQVTTQPAAAPAAALDDRVSWSRRLRWVALAAAPSSLMLGATTYMTTDIAAIPQLWVLPLALYLLSFIIVFAKISPAAQSGAVLAVAFVGLGAVAFFASAFLEGASGERVLAPVLQGVCVIAALFSLKLVRVRDAHLIHRAFVLALPLVILLLLFLMLSDIKPKGITYTIALHLAMLFVVAMVCHGEMARDRPATKYLTEFFLWMSVGGVVGGLFNALVAPVVFNGIVEYQLAMVVACFLVPPLALPGPENRMGLYADIVLVGLFVAIGGVLLGLRVRDGDLDFSVLRGPTGRWFAAALAGGLAIGLIHILRSRNRSALAYLDTALPLTLGLLVAGLYWGLFAELVYPRVLGFAAKVNMEPSKLRLILTFGVPAVLCYTFVERPVRFGLSVGAVLLAAAVCGFVVERPEFQERSFFGVLKIDKSSEKIDDGAALEYRTLMHGTTMHGKQFLEAPWRYEPLTYYHHTGPVGHVFAAYNTDSSRPFGVIGLGTGTMATYALPDQHVTFYDIDPLVRRISFDGEQYFTYVADAKRREALLHLVMGDARLTMERQNLSDKEKYGLLVVDAFSSDAIPVHLITHDALQIYWSKMQDDGIVLFHISNRYLDLQPVLANFAAQDGLAGAVFSDDDQSPPGKARSTWVALARKPADLDKLQLEDRLPPPLRDAKTRRALRLAGLCAGSLDLPWKPLKPDPKVGVWTDDYSNLWSVFNRN